MLAPAAPIQPFARFKWHHKANGVQWLIAPDRRHYRPYDVKRDCAIYARRAPKNFRTKSDGKVECRPKRGTKCPTQGSLKTATAAAERRMSEVCAMQASKWDFDNTTDDDADDALSPKSPEAFADRFGIRAALIGPSRIGAIWFVRSPSFEKCSSIENVADRNACYDQLRQELLRPPAKGANIPKN